MTKAKKNHEKYLAKNIKTDPKLTWKYIKSKTKMKVGMPNLYTSNNKKKMTESDEEKAEVLSKFFNSVFVSEPEGRIPTIANKTTKSPMNVLNITPEDVYKKLANLNVNKSCGPDGIHPMFLKENAMSLCEPLAKLMNSSLEKGKVPEDWKCANVTALYKKGDSKSPSNYRPVSLTCILCKVMESLVRDHIIEFMTLNLLLSDKQFGFYVKAFNCASIT